MSENTLTTAQALNAFWRELDADIPEAAAVALLRAAAQSAMEYGLAVKEAVDA